MSANRPRTGGPHQEQVMFEDDPIIIALDFGTTYSGVAWVRRSYGESLNPNQIQVFKQWPSQVASQVRSEIEYDKEGCIRKWGYLEGPTKGENLRFSLLKSCLAVEGVENQRRKLEDLHGLSLPPWVTVQSLVSDYLNIVLDYVVEQLRKAGDLPEENIEGDKLLKTLEFVITFPAWWSPTTQGEFRKALSKTKLQGFIKGHKVHYLKEPEATMIGTLNAPHLQYPWLVKHRKNEVPYKHIAILDIGGGTLDFSAYTVKTWKPFKVEEIRTVGKQVGSSNVDIEFWKHFTATLRKSGVKPEEMNPRSRNAIIREFEKLKFSFPMDSDYILPLPQDNKIPTYLPSANIEDGQLSLSMKVMTSFFDIVIRDEIIPFLDEQKKELEQTMSWKETALFLIGGFGCCSYLQEKIKKWGKGIDLQKLIIPQNSWTAVVRGAAKFGVCQSLKEVGLVSSRVSESSIGIVRDIRWERDKHSKDEKRKNPGNKPVVKDQIEWLVTKGQQLERKEVSLQRTFKDWPSSWNEVLVTCDEDPLPPQFTAQGVTPFGVIKVVVKGVPESERKKSQYMLFRRYYKVNYTLSISFPGTNIVAEMRYKENNYGQGEFKFPNPTSGGDTRGFVVEARVEHYEPVTRATL